MAFYTVFSPDGESPVKVMHEKHPQALYAAHQMAKAHPGKTFFVLKSASRSIKVMPDAADGNFEANEARASRLGDDLTGEI